VLVSWDVAASTGDMFGGFALNNSNHQLLSGARAATANSNAVSFGVLGETRMAPNEPS
jgi:hypothetical protein